MTIFELTREKNCFLEETRANKDSIHIHLKESFQTICSILFFDKIIHDYSYEWSIFPYKMKISYCMFVHVRIEMIEFVYVNDQLHQTVPNSREFYTCTTRTTRTTTRATNFPSTYSNTDFRCGIVGNLVDPGSTASNQIFTRLPTSQSPE